jgi:hypothetical protein
MADVWDQDFVIAMLAGRARTARPVSRTSMGLRRVGKTVLPVRHAQGMADVLVLVSAHV